MAVRCRFYPSRQSFPGGRTGACFAKYIPVQQSARQDVKLKSFSLDPFTNVLNEYDLDNNALYRRLRIPLPTDHWFWRS